LEEISVPKFYDPSISVGRVTNNIVKTRHGLVKGTHYAKLSDKKFMSFLSQIIKITFVFNVEYLTLY